MILLNILDLLLPFKICQDFKTHSHFKSFQETQTPDFVTFKAEKKIKAVISENEGLLFVMFTDSQFSGSDYSDSLTCDV